MKKFEMEVIMRKWNPETDREGPEECYASKKVAGAEYLARRKVLCDALATGYLVSHIRVLRVSEV